MWKFAGPAWLPLFTEMLLRAETGLVDAVSYLPIMTEHRSSQLIDRLAD